MEIYREYGEEKNRSREMTRDRETGTERETDKNAERDRQRVGRKGWRAGESERGRDKTETERDRDSDRDTKRETYSSLIARVNALWMRVSRSPRFKGAVGFQLGCCCRGGRQGGGKTAVSSISFKTTRHPIA